MKHIAVIGAGPAGCLAAYELKKNGHSVVLFEKERQVGGRTFTDRKNDHLIDTGAGFFTNFYPLYFKLLKELKLTDEVIPMSRSVFFAFDNKNEVLGTLASFIFFKALSFKDKFKFFKYVSGLIFKFKSLDLVDIKKLSHYDDCSFADEVRRNAGNNVYEFLARPLIEPFWFFSPEEISRALGMTVLARLATSKIFTMKTGMDRLCQALANTVIKKTNTCIEKILVNPDQSFTLTYTDNGQITNSEPFTHLIIASTAPVAYNLVKPLSENLVSSFQKDFLKTQKYVSSSHSVYQISRANPPLNQSGVFPCGPGQHKVATISFDQVKYKSYSHLKKTYDIAHVFLSPVESLKTMAKKSEEIFASTWENARGLYSQLPNSPLPVATYFREHAIPLHEVGRYKKALLFSHQQKAPLVFAGDYLATATIEGALLSGLNAAKLILQEN